jgi:glucose-1-phosphate adenylyltransferase
MNLMDMYHFHVEKKAELTIACNYVRPGDVKGLGIMGIDEQRRINRFVEKPSDLSLVEGMDVEYRGSKMYPGSMGIYLFNIETLIDVLDRDTSKVDFGKEIIPETIKTKDTSAYLFDGYWRDIGTIKNFYEENLLLTRGVPPLDMFDEKWQIFTRPRYLSPSKFQDSTVTDSIVAEGAIIASSKLLHSIIGLRVRVGENTLVEHSILMGCDYYETMEDLDHNRDKGIPPLGVGKNCVIKKAIIDKNVRIGDNVVIENRRGLENEDGPNYYIRDGIIIIPKNSVVPSGTVI